jgi:hypothetical protein
MYENREFGQPQLGSPFFPWYGNYGLFIGFGAMLSYSETFRLSATVTVYHTHAAMRTAKILCYQRYETISREVM